MVNNDDSYIFFFIFFFRGGSEATEKILLVNIEHHKIEPLTKIINSHMQQDVWSYKANESPTVNPHLMMASFAKASDYYFHSFGISANWVNSQFIEHESFFPPSSLGIEQELYICHPHQCKMVIYAVIWGLIQNDAVSSCPRWFLTVSRHKLYILRSWTCLVDH